MQSYYWNITDVWRLGFVLLSLGLPLYFHVIGTNLVFLCNIRPLLLCWWCSMHHWILLSEKANKRSLMVCSHSSDGHLSFDSALTCHKLIITQYTNLFFPYISSRPLLRMICIQLICFLGEHSWVLLAMLCCLQKYLSNICRYGSSPKHASSLYTLYHWLIQGQSVQEFKRKLVEL